MSAAAQTTWCRQIADALARSGVEMVAISPGSRSAPLALALIEESRLTTEVIVDERAAAFFALGAARGTGKPAAAVCTSGSAGAHYHPAVIEAERAGIPLLLLTADRPPERHHRQAPQTTEQVGFYGAHCRGSFDLGPAEAAARMLTATARTVALAVGRARGTRGSTPGPVQINLRLRKPLEPDPQAPPIVEASLPTVHRPDSVPAAASLEALAEICRSRSRGLILAGPAHPWTALDPTVLARFARRTGMPVVAEAASQLRFAPRPLACHRCESWEWLLRCDRLKDLGPPDLLLHFGPPSTPSGAGTLSQAFPDATLAVVHPGAEGDPADRSALIVPAEAKPTLEGLLERIGDGPGSHEDWGRRIGALDTAAWLEIESALARESDFIEAIAVRAVLENLPGGALLALANSLPIREVDLFCPGAMARVPVLHQRGAHGIDGMVAGAAGAGRASRRPVVLLCGDLALLHDVGALAVARRCTTPLVIVVLDNGGGRLFEMLPAARSRQLRASFDELFLADPALDFRRLAEAFEIPAAVCDDPHSLGRAIRQASTRAGCTLIVARVGQGAARTIADMVSTLHPRLLEADS